MYVTKIGYFQNISDMTIQILMIISSMEIPTKQLKTAMDSILNQKL